MLPFLLTEYDREIRRVFFSSGFSTHKQANNVITVGEIFQFALNPGRSEVIASYKVLTGASVSRSRTLKLGGCLLISCVNLDYPVE